MNVYVRVKFSLFALMISKFSKNDIINVADAMKKKPAYHV